MKVNAVRGVLWSGVEFAGGEILSFFVFLVLARLLTPADFGLITVASVVFISLAQVFLVQGFSDSLIQRDELSPDHCSTAFWVNLAIAAGLIVVTLLAAEPLATAFRQPALANMLRWLSLVFVFTALNSVHQALFRRRLSFASFALRAAVGIAAGGAVGVAMALAGCGVWSLVGQQVANGAVSVVVIWSTSEWRPSFRFSRRCLADMGAFSSHVIAGHFVKFAYQRIDILLIGLLIDASRLGYYYLAIRLLVTGGLLTQSAVLPVVLPVFARLQRDPERFREAFLLALRMTQAIYLPLVIGLGAVADPLVPLFFGAHWQPTVPLLEIMSLSGFLQLFSYFTIPALTALARPRVALRLSLLQVAVALAVVVPATLFGGIVGAAVAFSLIFLVVAPFHLAAMRRHAGISPWQQILGVRASVIASLAMAGIVLAAKAELLASLPAPAALALLIVIGAVTYAAAFAMLGRDDVKALIDFATSAAKRRGLAAEPDAGPAADVDGRRRTALPGDPG